MACLRNGRATSEGETPRGAYYRRVKELPGRSYRQESSIMPARGLPFVDKGKGFDDPQLKILRTLIDERLQNI